MSDAVQIVTVLSSLIGAMFTAWLTFLMWKVTQGQAKAAVEVRKVRVRAGRVEKKADAAAVEVRHVKTTLAESTGVIAGKLDAVIADVKEVHLATNSMKDELVKKTEAEALARGGVEERARAEAKQAAADNPPGGA